MKRPSAMARLIGICLFAALPWAGTVHANDFGACSAMVEITGAPEYKGDEPLHEVLCRLGYVLAHNPDTKVPDWVLEDLTGDRLDGSARRRDNFKPDDDLTPGLRAELSDYKGSGFARGHMAPAADMSWDQTAMDESFLLSNMAPQIGPGFNSGIWSRLENAVREWAQDSGQLIVITGPIYDGSAETIGVNNVRIPEAFYKIVYNPETRRAIGFKLPNERTVGHQLDEFIVKIRDLEEETGLNFLAGLPAREQNRIEKRASHMWRADVP